MKMIWVWLLVLCASLTAAEGMWTLDQLLELNLEEQGLEVLTTELWNEKDGGISKAVISIGGCTASFVSANGLIATNQHCAYGALQRNSTADNNVLENGFNAKTLQDELPTFGTEAYVLQSFKDVTDEVLSAVKKDMTPAERAKAIDKKIMEMEENVEAADSTIRARVAEMYSGQSYVLFKHLHIKDVRLVYAPPKDVGKFGGDIDNFEWPRHTGDWAFLRAYVGPDGIPAEPSEDNVPYQPEKWLEVSTDGYQEGDLSMVIGYPGGTSRYRTSYSIKYLQEYYYPWRLDLLERAIALIEERTAEDEDADIKLESLYSGLNNSLKNSQGQYDGFMRTNLYDLKVELENEFREKMENSPELQKKYGDVLPAIKELYADYETYQPKRYLVLWMSYVNDVYSAVNTLYRYATEKEKPAAERRPGYTEKDMQRTAKRWEYGYRNYDQEFDKRILALFFELAHELPDGMKIEAIENISGDKTGKAQKQADRDFIDRLYAETEFTELK